MLVHPELRKVHEISKGESVSSYYMKKYAYLKEHGFFGNSKVADFKTEINESIVEESIIQTQQIVFEVTDFCNLRCLYCVQGDLYENINKKNSGNIDIDSAISLLKYIFDLKRKNNQTKFSVSFYGGEPLLNILFIKQIVKVVQQLNYEKKIDITYLMTTNATLLDRYISFLVENSFKLMISLDGNQENDSYRSFRKNSQNSFQKVIENLDMIQREYPSYFVNHISFNAVLHNRNSVKDIFEFIYNRYHKIPQISELASNNVKPDRQGLFDKMFRNKRNSEIEFQEERSDLMHLMGNQSLLFRELVNFSKYYSVNFYIWNIASLLLNEEKYYPTNTCIPFSKKIFLTNRNLLLPCEKISHKYSMGKVNQNVIIDIPEIVRQYNSYYKWLEKTCQYCYAHKFCGVCMFNINNLGAKEFVCDSFHSYEVFQSKLCRIFSFLEKHPKSLYQILEDIIITS